MLCATITTGTSGWSAFARAIGRLRSSTSADHPLGPRWPGSSVAAREAPWSAVVVAVHRVPRRGQGLGDVVVSAQVLTHAVDEHDDAGDTGVVEWPNDSRRAACRPRNGRRT